MIELLPLWILELPLLYGWTVYDVLELIFC